MFCTFWYSWWDLIGIMLLRHMPNRRQNDHHLVATILSSTKHSEWGNDWSVLYYSELYYKILFKMRNKKRQLYPNSEYCYSNLIIIDVIHIIIPWICVHKQGIRTFIYRSVSVPLLMNEYYVRCHGWDGTDVTSQTWRRLAAVSVHCTKSCIYSQKVLLRMGEFVARNM